MTLTKHVLICLLIFLERWVSWGSWMFAGFEQIISGLVWRIGILIFFILAIFALLFFIPFENNYADIELKDIVQSLILEEIFNILFVIVLRFTDSVEKVPINIWKALAKTLAFIFFKLSATWTQYWAPLWYFPPILDRKVKIISIPGFSATLLQDLHH